MDQEPFVPIEVLAKHFTVSVPTMRSWLHQGYIPSDTYVKIGNTYRFKFSRVVAALTGQPKEDAKLAEQDETGPAETQLELDFVSADQDQ